MAKLSWCSVAEPNGEKSYLGRLCDERVAVRHVAGTSSWYVEWGGFYFDFTPHHNERVTVLAERLLVGWLAGAAKELGLAVSRPKSTEMKESSEEGGKNYASTTVPGPV